MSAASTFIFAAALYVVLRHSAINGACADVDGFQTTTHRLKKQIFCDYNKNVQPFGKNSTSTRVYLTIFPEQLIFLDFLHAVQLNCLMFVVWSDPTLAWNATEFDGVEELSINSEDIWIPPFKFLELVGNRLTGHSMEATQLILESDGDIFSWIQVKFLATCDTDIRKWPFDQHNCNISIQSPTPAVVFFTERHIRELRRNYYTPSPKWKLLNGTIEQVDSLGDGSKSLSKVAIYLTFRRLSGEGVAGVIVPAIVLTVLTWITFILESRSAERLAVICVNILCHCSYLLHIYLRIPPNGDSVPLIVQFYRDSFFMAGFTLLITFLVRQMDTTSSSPPAWVAGVVNGVLGTRPGKMLLMRQVGPKDDAAVVDVRIAEEKGPNKWHLFVKIVNCGSLASCILATFVLTIKCLF